MKNFSIKKQNKTSIFKTVLLTCLSFVMFAQEQEKPNILVIVSDDQGFSDIDIAIKGFESQANYGVNTPALKELSRTSYFFNNAYTTGNICAPTRAGIMTGNYQQRQGIFNGGSGDLGMPNEIPFIPEYLGESYSKAAFGKWHSGEEVGEHDPRSKGFDSYLGYFAKGGHDYFLLNHDETRPDHNAKVGQLCYLKKVYTQAMMRDDILYNKDYKGEPYDFHTDEERYADLIKDIDPCGYLDKKGNGVKKIYMTRLLSFEALEFIKKNVEDNSRNEKKGRSRKPFFCYLAYTALHSPLQAPMSARRVVKSRFSQPKTGKYSSDLAYEDRVTYLAMLDIMDQGIQKIINYLKDQNVFDNTLIIYLTDNGGAENMQANNGGYRDFKQTNYQGGIKTPFLVSWPAGLPKNMGNKGILKEDVVLSFDILPTIIEAAQVKNNRNLRTNKFDGQSLIPIIKGETESNHKLTFWSEGAEKFNLFLDGKENPLGEFAIIDHENNRKIYSEVTFKKRTGSIKKGNLKFENIQISLNETSLIEENGLQAVEANYNKIENPKIGSTFYNMLKRYEEWLKVMKTPINENNIKSFFIPNKPEHAVTVYKDIYYRYDEKVDGKELLPVSYSKDIKNIDNIDFKIRSIVVSEGYVATLKIANSDKVLVINGSLDENNKKRRGVGIPLFLEKGFDGNISSIKISKSSSSRREKDRLSKNGHTTEARSLKVWKNANTNHVTIKSGTTIKYFEVFDIRGNRILSKSNVNTTTAGFDVGEISEGLFLVRVINKDGVVLPAKKILISH